MQVETVTCCNKEEHIPWGNCEVIWVGRCYDGFVTDLGLFDGFKKCPKKWGLCLTLGTQSKAGCCLSLFLTAKQNATEQVSFTRQECLRLVWPR